MRFLRRAVIALGHVKFVLVVGGLGAFPSIFYFQQFANSIEEAALSTLVPFAVFVMIGIFLLKVSKISRQDLSEHRTEARKSGRNWFKQLPPYKKALVIIGAIVVFIIFNAADFLSLFD